MEKYGKVPPRFTKDWWEWFFEYYRVHIIAAAFAAFLVGVTVFQFTTRINYDVTVTYICETMPDETAQKKVADKLAEAVFDVNENGKTEVLFQAMLSSRDGVQNAEYTAAGETKKMLELQAGETFLFAACGSQVKSWENNGLLEGIFSPADSWLSEEDKTLSRAEGVSGKYFVKLPEDNLIKEFFGDNEDIYVAIREIRDKEDKQKAEKMRDAGVMAAQYLLKTK